MKNLIGLILVLAFSTPSGPAAQKSASAARNLEWAGVTLDKIERDLASVIRDHHLQDTTALDAAFKSARDRLTNLKKAAAAPDAEALVKAMELTRSVGGLVQSVLERINDLDEKRELLEKLNDDNPSLAKTDLDKRFNAGLRLMAEGLLRQVACELGQQRLDAAKAEGDANLAALRCDQLLEEGNDEGAYLRRRGELEEEIRSAGKTIGLRPLDTARDAVRASKRQQQASAVEKLNHTNHISRLNLHVQLLDEQASGLNEATARAQEAYDQAQEAVQQALDDN